MELRLSGSGGQGLILAGVIIAEAALIDGKRAVQSQSYGPEARGGASRAEVIISSREIDFIKVQSADLLLCLTQTAYDRYAKEPAAVLILDDAIEPKYHTPEQVTRLPILSTAAEKAGRPMVANIVALGAVNAIMKLVSKESLAQAVLGRVPKGTQELNSKALEYGYEIAENRMNP
jgi:2-oxoglutarate ferredoxin oxidoreductase subunit gamma